MNTKNQKEERKEIIISKKVWIADKYNFFEYMSVMLDWWVWITEALDSVTSKIASPYFKQKIRELSTYILSWDSFSKAMKKIPLVFESSEISIVESWEAVGQLSKSFMKLSDDLKRIHELKNKIKTALTYPMIIFLFMILALIIVLVWVIPQLMPLFEDSGVELPATTKALVAVSDFVINNIWIIVLSIATLVVLVVGYTNTKSWKESVEQLVLNFPLVGPIYKNYILANLALNLSTLVWSWISIIKALTLVWKSSNSVVYEQIFEEVVLKVSKWEGIVKSIEDLDKENEYFPKDYLQMLAVWEKTASLDTISNKVWQQYEKEVDYSLARLTKWIEPIAILLAWIFVAWFALAIFWAITKVTDTI